jgi:hypothetical protein
MEVSTKSVFTDMGPGNLPARYSRDKSLLMNAIGFCTRVVASLLVPALSACSTEALYGTTQAWQRNQCERLMDRGDRERCLSRTAVPYEQYKRAAEAGQQPASR